MNAAGLFQNILNKRSFLCIGLDTDIDKIPIFLSGLPHPQFEFNKAVVETTHDLAVAFKINTAFYEALGAEGWAAMEKTIRYLRSVDPSLFLIADAKRGDIGNTSELYARAFFDNLGFDAITLSPYMGYDTIEPFLRRMGTWVVILAVTSNRSATDFQFLDIKNSGKRLFEEVINKGCSWGSTDNIMFVAGATQAEQLSDVRKYAPDHFLLVPGIGTQGGSLEKVASAGFNATCGVLVNVSRSIIFAGTDQSFARAARSSALNFQQKMESLLKKHNLLEGS